MVGTQSLQRALDLLKGEGPGPLPCLGGQEELVTMGLHPGPEPELGVTITGRGVDVVDPVRADQLHGLIRLLLADVADGGGAEDDSRAVVTGWTERLLLHHAAHSALRPRLAALGQQNRDLTLGPLLIPRVRRIGLDGPAATRFPAPHHAALARWRRSAPHRPGPPAPQDLL